MPKAILAVYANTADPGREAEFNDWYTGTHIPEVLALDGFQRATRYRVSDAQIGGSSEHRYVTFYEIDAPELQPVLDGLGQGFRSGAITMNDSMAPGPVLVWEQVGEAITSK